MQIGTIIIDVNYSDDLLKRNKSVVVFICQRSDNKVIKTTVVEREALPDWFKKTTISYAQHTYRYILAGANIIGEMLALVEEKDVPKGHTTKDYSLN
jgi:hypothetical protein